MGCIKKWLTRPGDKYAHEGLEITYIRASPSSARISILFPWGEFTQAEIPYNSPGWEHWKDFNSPNYIDIRYPDYWDTSTGFAIQIESCQGFPGMFDPEPEFGFGKGEITQTNIGPGLIFNVGSKIEYSLRVMNTGDTGKIYGAVGLGYHDEKGMIYFTGRYANEQAQVLGGEMVTWNGYIEVLHKDYAAREMTPRGPAVYFMSGHEENGDIVWDRSEYIPVNLILKSGYIDPLDPEGPPEDWPEPIPEPKPERDLISFIYIGLMGLIGYLLMRTP